MCALSEHYVHTGREVVTAIFVDTALTAAEADRDQVVTELLEMEDAARRAFKVMSRMLNVQQGKGWTRWRLVIADARAAEAQRDGEARAAAALRAERRSARHALLSLIHI